MFSHYSLPLSIIAVAVLLINWRIIRHGYRRQRRSEHGTVVSVVDGDTIRVRINGKVETVRYIGINTPERDDPGFVDATRQNRQLVAFRDVRLESDCSDEDIYGRKLRYVWVGRTFVNRELVRLGCAEVMAVHPNTKRIQEIQG